VICRGKAAPGEKKAENRSALTIKAAREVPRKEVSLGGRVRKKEPKRFDEKKKKKKGLRRGGVAHKKNSPRGAQSKESSKKKREPGKKAEGR